MKIDSNTKIWFTSDLHFDHKNILRLQPNRKHETVAEMNNHIIDSWNSTVGANDIVFILGDITFSREKYCNLLTGNKIVILGNHDYNLSDFNNVYPYLEIIYKGQKIILFHYPIVHWNGADRGTWHLHGHTHASFTNAGKSMDVGWDTTGKLYSFDDVEAIMENKEINSRY